MSSAVVCLEPEKSAQGSSRAAAHSEIPNPQSAIDNRNEPPYLGCCESRGTLINEDMPFRGFANDYVLSKRLCEQIVLQSPVDSVILRPSIVLSHGVQSPEFARAVLWVLPVIRRLGVLPMSGDEMIDAVSVGFVANAVAEMVERPLSQRIYHLSAGIEASVTWQEVFAALTKNGHDYSHVRFAPDLDWTGFGRAKPRLRHARELVSYYLPFMRAGVVYDCTRLKQALDCDFPECPKVTDYCVQLLDLFTEREAFEEALRP